MTSRAPRLRRLHYWVIAVLVVGATLAAHSPPAAAQNGWQQHSTADDIELATLQQDTGVALHYGCSRFFPMCYHAIHYPGGDCAEDSRSVRVRLESDLAPLEVNTACQRVAGGSQLVFVVFEAVHARIRRSEALQVRFLDVAAGYADVAFVLGDDAGAALDALEARVGLPPGAHLHGAH